MYTVEQLIGILPAGKLIRIIDSSGESYAIASCAAMVPWEIRRVRVLKNYVDGDDIFIVIDI